MKPSLAQGRNQLLNAAALLVLLHLPSHPASPSQPPALPASPNALPAADPARPTPPVIRLHPFNPQPDQPNRLRFATRETRFVRFLIHESQGGQPCLDELEVYGPDPDLNLALASRGARATASSCLPGYPIHQVAHLNDGLYGNPHSWIAATASDEFAQIELPNPALVSEVVFSRDRHGRFRDRLPAQFEVQLSFDGQHWTTVLRCGQRIALPPQPTHLQLLHYAFLSEQSTWSRIDPSPPLTRVLRQMHAMLLRMEQQGIEVADDRSAFDRLQQLAQRLAASPATTDEALESAYLEARLAKRQLFLRHPDLAPLQQIAFVARHPYEPSHNYSDILDAHWRPGGGLRLLSIPMTNQRLDPARATITPLFDAGPGVARDAYPSFDASHIYFAYRSSPSDYFHLYSIHRTGQNPRQLTHGPFHDYYPCPLPDGGLAFISTRCKARFLCWRPQAFVLFRMDPDASHILPLSYANLSEWAPTIMRDGHLLWTRSEYLDKGADFGHTLWTIRPDGTHADLLFGNNTLHCYVNAREVPDSHELSCTLISHGGDLNGPIALLDPRQGRFNPAAITNITPDVPPRFHMDWAQRECFRDPVPIARDLFLVSHAPQNHFGLYVIDRYGNRELLYLDPLIGAFCPNPLLPQPTPPILAHTPALDPTPNEGVFILQDVYHGLEPAVPRGAIRFLRVCQEVRADLERLPNGEYRQDHPPFEDFYASPTHLVRGPAGWPTYVAKAALGLASVEEDGSASFYAPAGKVLYFQALDQDLNEIQRMRSVTQLQPGETRGCIGCHEHRSTAVPANLTTAARRPPHRLQPPPWGPQPFAYEKIVQPVWNEHCVRCHDHNDPHRLDLSATLGPDRVPASYRTLITQGWVHYFDCAWGQEHHKAPPQTFGTLQSKLIPFLQPSHYDVALTPEDLHRVKCWIDLNCPLWPDYLQRDLRPTQTAQTTP